ncbi:chitobiase/beta-hexosaminidase C-terminal domain-containing protein [Novosphingobium acidiphilum]|uniref:chitobiase/beta-hexosaminidase C-terminal domain-containing protein n=1 Tax=Novosphingobium acidiphilum TaxID=505248 RepID=UPI000684D932|nr:chitobiase/beta-hexosaminidase C-terminal domain-containing protein [Novosphingobium acidiphilum]
MRRRFVPLLAGVLVLGGCGGGSTDGSPATPVAPAVNAAAAPRIGTSAALGGAVVVSLSSTTTGATIHYTTDGTTPTSASPQYQAPFLVTSSQTVQAVAMASGLNTSAVATQSLTVTVPSGTLVWSDEFANTSGSPIAPDAAVWTYDTGNSGFGNSELETYCAAGSNAAPCQATAPNAWVGGDGLHIVARNPSAGVYTSARLKTQGLFSFRYGRLEVMASVPEAQGLWPAIWTLGNSIATAGWPASGEQDVMEHVNAATTPDVIAATLHSPGADPSTQYRFPAGQTAAGLHAYGMVWSPQQVAFYVDDPANVYATYTAAQVTALNGGVWPFDNGQANFILLNLAVGGAWPGPPDGTTPWPSEMVVKYVRIYAN